MKVKKFGFIYFGFYVCPIGKTVIEVRQAEATPKDQTPKIEVISNIDNSTHIEILTPQEFNDKYQGYNYFTHSYKHFFKKNLEGWIY